MISPFHMPNSPVGYNNQQNYNPQMGPVFPGYSSPGYRVQGDLNVAPFSIPPRYNPPDNYSNEGWSVPSYSSNPGNNQQQQSQINNYEPIKQGTNNPFYQMMNGTRNFNSTSGSTTKTPNTTPNISAKSTTKPNNNPANQTTTTKR